MTVTIDDIPVYQALVNIDDPALGMFKISLVDDPAVQSDFLSFDRARKQMAYAVKDAEKRLVLGVVMRADFPIYRRDKGFGEYYVIYSADTIRAMAEKYLMEGRQNDVNLMHEKGSDVEGVDMVQYFIKDTGKGVAPAGFDDVADGSLFAEFHVVNDEVWDAIKEGTYKGFSLEGVFDLVPEQDADKVADIVDELDGVFQRIINHCKSKADMSKVKGLLARLARALVEMGNVTTDKGILSWEGDDDLKAGDAVYVKDEKGDAKPAPDGDYTTVDGKVIVVADGKVSEIKDAKAEVAPEPEETESAEFVQTDKGKLSWDNEDDDLKAGDAVYVKDENGNRSPAPDGDYTTNDGKIIKVVDGKVAEITDPNAEVDEEGARQEPGLFQRIRDLFSESYDEKFRKIWAAIVALGYEDGWIVDAGDDFAVAQVWKEDTSSEVNIRFKIEWNDNGEAVASDPVEVVPAFVTPEEKKAADAELVALQEQVVALTAENAELRQKPAGTPAHEEFQSGAIAGSTGDKRLDRLARILAAR